MIYHFLNTLIYQILILNIITAGTINNDISDITINILY